MLINEVFNRNEVDQLLPYDAHNNDKYTRTNPEKWRGPHEGRYLTLMLAGKKPVVLIHKNDKKFFQSYINDGTLIDMGEVNMGHEVISNGIPYYHYYVETLITLPGHEWRATKIRQLFKERDKDPSLPNSRWHAKFGILLGYSNQEIKKWLANKSLIQNLTK